VDECIKEVECPACEEIIFSANKKLLVQVHWELCNTFSGKTTNGILEDDDIQIQEEDIKNAEVTPSVNTLKEYEIDTNTRISDLSLNFQPKCSCGNVYDLDMEVDYSIPKTIEFELAFRDE
jgi:hypothetical protein